MACQINKYRDHLVDQLVNKFDIGRGFVQAYLRYWSESHGQQLTDISEIEALPCPHSKWFYNAISTNQQGTTLVNWVKQTLPTFPRRYLDVGCGLGGRLVAFSREGAEVYGIEKDHDIRRLGVENCADYGLSQSMFLDDLDAIEEKKEERFDLVVCLDPIRQLSPDRDLMLLLNALRHNGHLFLQIPNCTSLSVVCKDTHFSLFALSLLALSDATAYCTWAKSPKPIHFPYLSVLEYKEKLEESGYRVWIPEPEEKDELSAERLAIFTNELLRGYSRFMRDDAPRMDRKLAAKVDAHFRRYLTNFIEDAIWLNTGERSTQWFCEKYLATQRKLLATKVESDSMRAL
ncbi:MAG: class I SAM-dependent methyltransferase [Deltaproteobacteria bacterium]|nr:class I SAM-dependent methyltransferase [Deltaproteobacteria bacterium]MDL1961784.1 class I SAM-dependent methyltransferase [Deltaproteobacteria bacterium]